MTIEGVVFQSDASSPTGRWFIRPFETVDRLVAGLKPPRGSAQLAMHTGVHVRLDDGTEAIVEQRTNSPCKDLVDALAWSSMDQFRARDNGGWHVSVPPWAFRGIDQRAVDEAIERLNHLEGRSFVVEDCTAMVERVFGGRRLFADSPLLRTLGIGFRVGDPALPLIRSDVVLPPAVEDRLQAGALARLPAPRARSDAPNVRIWAYRLGMAAVAGAGIGWILGTRRKRSSASRP